MRRLVVWLVGGAVLLAVGFTAGLAFPEEALQPATATPTATHTPTASPSATRSPTPSQTASATPSDTPTAAPTDTPSPSGPPTDMPRPSRTPTITPTPTFDPPDGRVLQQANCRYGPGAAYLYEWGLYPKNRVDILARNHDGSWLYVHPWYFQGDCWVRADLIEVIRGDVMALQEFYGLLPFSELYKPPRTVSAVRDGDQVTVMWSSVWMTEDDYRGYLIEAWLCVDGQIVFTPVAVDGTVVILHDEAGCLQPSSARIYTAEKHGYTEWRRIPWPPHDPAAAPTATPAG